MQKIEGNETVMCILFIHFTIYNIKLALLAATILIYRLNKLNKLAAQ